MDGRMWTRKKVIRQGEISHCPFLLRTFLPSFLPSVTKQLFTPKTGPLSGLSPQSSCPPSHPAHTEPCVFLRTANITHPNLATPPHPSTQTTYAVEISKWAERLDGDGLCVLTTSITTTADNVLVVPLFTTDN